MEQAVRTSLALWEGWSRPRAQALLGGRDGSGRAHKPCSVGGRHGWQGQQHHTWQQTPLGQDGAWGPWRRPPLLPVKLDAPSPRQAEIEPKGAPPSSSVADRCSRAASTPNPRATYAGFEARARACTEAGKDTRKDTGCAKAQLVLRRGKERKTLAATAAVPGCRHRFGRVRQSECEHTAQGCAMRADPFLPGQVPKWEVRLSGCVRVRCTSPGETGHRVQARHTHEVHRVL